MSSELQSQLESMTIGQWQARLILKSASFMATFVESTPDDKARWRPSIDEKSQTRSILEQVGECIFANVRFFHILQGETPPSPPAEWDTFESKEVAIQELTRSAQALADVVEKLDSAALAKEYPTHRGPMPGALAIQFPVRNMTYHMGQINLIQLLYGDTHFHISKDFTTF